MMSGWWQTSSGESSCWLPESRLPAMSSHSRESALASLPLLLMAPVLWNQGSTCITSFNFNHLTNALFPNTVTWAVRVAT